MGIGAELAPEEEEPEEPEEPYAPSEAALGDAGGTIDAAATMELPTEVAADSTGIGAAVYAVCS